MAHLVRMGANDEDWSFRCVALHRMQPELETRVLVAEAKVPHQKVDGATCDEKLQYRYSTGSV